MSPGTRMLAPGDGLRGRRYWATRAIKRHRRRWAHKKGVKRPIDGTGNWNPKGKPL